MELDGDAHRDVAYADAYPMAHQGKLAAISEHREIPVAVEE